MLEARRRADAGETRARFTVVSPQWWTIFSGRTAQVRGAGGTVYELSPDFPAVLHELIRVHINTSLLWQTAPPCYELSFRPGIHHPRFDPTRHQGRAEGPPAGTSVSLRSPQALSSILVALAPNAPNPPSSAPGDGNSAGRDSADRDNADASDSPDGS